MFLQTSNHDNFGRRVSYVEDWITRILLKEPNSDFLDLGAGLSPFKKTVEFNGGQYFSQDFSGYFPSKSQIGLQNDDWDYPEHDYICDIFEFKPDRTFRNILCTEVLEHVDNPIDVIRVIADLAEVNGRIIITVPMMSLIHQAPHYYSSGLSVYWFKRWMPYYGLQIDEMVISGDFADLLDQEITRGISQLPRFWRNRAILRLKRYFINLIRANSEVSILQSGGFGIFVVATKLRPNQDIQPN